MPWSPRFVLQMLPLYTAASAVQPYRENVFLLRQAPILPAAPPAADGRGMTAAHRGRTQSLLARLDLGSLALSIEPAAH